MATRDWQAIKTEYVTGEKSQRDIAAERGVSAGAIGTRCAAEDWEAEREQYRAKLSEKTRAEAEKRELSARLMVGEAAALAFADFKGLKPSERGARFPELAKQWAAMTGETTERSVIDATLHDWRAGKTADEIAAVEEAARMVNEKRGA